MARQSDKPQTIKTTNPQTVELAGTIGSTSESFVGESRGRYALSTSASTTITNAQNLYPELWNRAPAGWKSAAPDLVVPAQGVAYSDEDYSLSVSLSSPPGDVSANNTNLIVKRRGNKLILQGWTEITSADWSLISGGNIQLVIGETFNRVGGLTTTLYVTSTTASGWNQEQSAIAWTGGVSGTGTTILLYTSDGSGDGAVDYNDLNSNMRIYWSGAELTIPALNDTLPIPYIHLYDSVAAGALGLPEATESVSGIVTRNQVTEAGRNYIINGAMEFNQRGPDSASATSRYVLDRWVVNASGATVLGSLIEVSNVPFSNYMRLVASTADDNWGWFQRIERPKDFSNNTYTLSFEARSADGSVAGFRIEPSFIFGSDTNEELTTTDITLSTSFVKHTVTITTPDLSGKTIGDNDYFSIGFIQKLNQTGQFDLRKVKLEEGTVATKFTRAGGSYAGELALCQRYYYDFLDGVSLNILGVNQAISPTVSSGILRFPVEMREVPSMGFSNLSHFAAATVSAGDLTVTGFDFQDTRRTKKSTNVVITVASGLSAGNASTWRATNASAKLFADAEL